RRACGIVRGDLLHLRRLQLRAERGRAGGSAPPDVDLARADRGGVPLRAAVRTALRPLGPHRPESRAPGRGAGAVGTEPHAVDRTRWSAPALVRAGLPGEDAAARAGRGWLPRGGLARKPSAA